MLVEVGSFGGGPFNGPEDFSLWERCITRGLPGSMLPGVYGNSYQIVQGPGFVAIRYEMVHETRVIPLDSRPRLGKDLRFDIGSARGHWEGDTLVVETTNFKQRSAYRNANADTLRLVERFRRTSADRVEWSVTVEDPVDLGDSHGPLRCRSRAMRTRRSSSTSVTREITRSSTSWALRERPNGSRRPRSPDDSGRVLGSRGHVRRDSRRTPPTSPSSASYCRSPTPRRITSVMFPIQ